MNEEILKGTAKENSAQILLLA